MADPFGPCILAAAFLLFAAIVCALNAALPSVDEDGVRERGRSEDDPAARRLARLLDRYDRGRGDFRMAFALMMSASAASLLSWAAPAAAGALGLPVWLCSLALLIVYAVLAVTLALILPASIAAHSPEAAISRLAAPGEWILRALTPVMLAAYGLGMVILRPFRIRPGGNAERVTEKEIRMMMDIGEEEGAIESDKKEMIENIFDFHSMIAFDCMVHRRDITAIDADATADEVLSTIAESGLSRFPVYEDNIDNILGVLTSRDFLLSRCRGDERPVRSLVRPPYLVPESVRTDVLFREMQTQKQHMAIVIDEYGGTSGLITLEDLLEEIVGNIYDEFDPMEAEDITPLGEKCWRVAGSTDLEALAEATGAPLELDEEYDTLGGLVFSQLNEIPPDGARPVVECFGLRVQVTEIADRRVVWAIVERIPDPVAPAEPGE